ncbi:YfhD family protein [Halobacillus salinarum]|uniref:YfhD family protein n=1 Tax=Halobacillus salinarum TaxID=2932257 RepID=A0ABY4EPC3_9BACI|nr:YfhD family protein [Halobacillus salinarum]UOQ46003.1 YfhD family protein [Halobacillus salinarum]
MGRDEHRHSKGKNKRKLPQTPKNLKRDGIDVEFSSQLADEEDWKAVERAQAADLRAHSKMNKEER